jgi:hypothetical protein
LFSGDEYVALKKIILLTACFSMFSYRGKTTEAMELIGEWLPVKEHEIPEKEYEMHELGRSQRPDTIPLDTSPLDDFMDIIISIKFWAQTQIHSFNSQPAVVDRKKVDKPHS